MASWGEVKKVVKDLVVVDPHLNPIVLRRQIIYSFLLMILVCKEKNFDFFLF